MGNVPWQWIHHVNKLVSQYCAIKAHFLWEICPTGKGSPVNVIIYDFRRWFCKPVHISSQMFLHLRSFYSDWSLLLSVLHLQNFSHSRCSASVCGAMKISVIRKRGTDMCILNSNTYSDTCQGPGQFNFPDFPFPISQINQCQRIN